MTCSPVPARSGYPFSFQKCLEQYHGPCPIVLSQRLPTRPQILPWSFHGQVRSILSVDVFLRGLPAGHILQEPSASKGFEQNLQKRDCRVMSVFRFKEVRPVIHGGFGEDGCYAVSLFAVAVKFDNGEALGKVGWRVSGFCAGFNPRLPLR